MDNSADIYVISAEFIHFSAIEQWTKIFHDIQKLV